MRTARSNPEAVLAQVQVVLARHAGSEGALLPILQDVQAAFGFLPAEAMGPIAHALNISRAELHGVISFYHDFRTAPPDRPVLRLCRAEACQARGGEALAERAAADDRIELAPVYCLGLCASGPAAMAGERLVARLDPERLERLIRELAA